MFTKRTLIIVTITCASILALGFGPRVANIARALPPAQTGVTIPYSGSLKDAAGQPVADGAYDFTFALYTVEKGGEPLWTETLKGVTVQEGNFTVLLGSVNSLPEAALDGGARWLEVGVLGPGETEFTRLSPRQELKAAESKEAPSSPSAASACTHDHFTETWTGINSAAGFIVDNNGTGDGIRGYSSATGVNWAGIFGVNDSAGGGPGTYGYSAHQAGVYGIGSGASLSYLPGAATTGVYGTGQSGVWGYAQGTGAGDGVVGTTTATGASGVYGYATNSYGVTGNSTNTFGMQAVGGGDASTTDGVGDLLLGGTNGEIFATSTGSGGMDLVSNYDVRLHLDKDNNNLLEWFRIYNGAGSEIFRVEENGDLWTPGSKAGYVVDVAKNDDVVSLEMGDVVIISGAAPAILGKNPLIKVRLAATEGTSAVVGVVDKRYIPALDTEEEARLGTKRADYDEAVIPPGEYLVVVTLGSFQAIKVDASYGAIAPGDLLVASPTPGYAMRADSPAPGTIIGKALEALASGKGVIPVIITLQ